MKVKAPLFFNIIFLSELYYLDIGLMRDGLPESKQVEFT